MYSFLDGTSISGDDAKHMIEILIKNKKTMKLSDKSFIEEENEKHYNLGRQHSRTMYLFWFLLGLTISALSFWGWFFYQASLV